MSENITICYASIPVGRGRIQRKRVNPQRNSLADGKVCEAKRRQQSCSRAGLQVCTPNKIRRWRTKDWLISPSAANQWWCRCHNPS